MFLQLSAGSLMRQQEAHLCSGAEVGVSCSSHQLLERAPLHPQEDAMLEKGSLPPFPLEEILHLAITYHSYRTLSMHVHPHLQSKNYKPQQ